MSRPALGLLGALVFAAALLANLPARLITYFLPQGEVVMNGLSGTVWRGQASRCVVRLEPGFAHLGALHWSLSPWSLLRLAPAVELSSAWGDQRLNAYLALRGEGDLDVRELEASLPAELVQEILPVALGGTFSVQIPALRLREGLVDGGEGRVVWRGAIWHSVRGALPLGDYVAEFKQEPGELLQARLFTLAGRIVVAGSVSVDGRQYAIDAEVTSEGAMDPDLRQALSLVGTPEDDGFRIQLDGTF